MKKIITIMIAGILLASCSSNKTEALKKGSPEYELFQTLSDSLGYTFFAPSKNGTLITTDEFTVKTQDVLPLIYQALGGQVTRAFQIDSSQAIQLLKTFSKSEAEKRLILFEADKKGIKVTQDSVEQNLKNIFPSYSNTEEFNKQLNAHNMTMGKLKRDVHDQMVIDVFLNKNVFTADAVTDQEVKDYYQQDRTASVRHILFVTRGKSDAEKAGIKKQALKVLALAKSGRNFKSLVKKYSEDPGSKNNDGLYENFKRGEMVKPFEDAAFTLPVGSISNLVETQFGYHIIKVVDRKKETKSYEQVKDQLKKELLNRKKRDIFFNYLNSLKEKHNYTEHFDKLA